MKHSTGVDKVRNKVEIKYSTVNRSNLIAVSASASASASSKISQGRAVGLR